MDATGSIMPGVDVKIYKGDAVVKQAVTSDSGEFEIPVDPGDYKLEVTAPDFNPHSEMVKVAPDMAPLTVTLELAIVSQNVEVTETRNEISIDSDSSLSTTTLGKDFIDALPDDEDDLASYLQQLAGGRGGAGNNASFVIDGFTGGRIPPKDQIQEIRINSNPYSSEFSGIGFGRTEIITRAGTGDFRGQMNFFFRDESLNGRNPFNVQPDGSVAKRPPYQARNFNTNFSGPIIRNKLSMSLQARHNTNENSDIIRATTVNPDGSLLQHYDPFVAPSHNKGINARTQYSLSKNNTLYTNLNYQRNDNLNQGLGGGGSFTLLERASDSYRRNTEFQMRESSVLNAKMIHEVRFDYSSNTSHTTPHTDAVAINVIDTFNGGGAQNNSLSNNRQSEFGNTLMYSGSKWTFKAGTQGVYRQDHSSSQSNFLGTWTFSTLADYLANKPLQFTQNTGNPILDVNQFEFSAFVQADYKLSTKFSISPGVRFEDQTNISDNNNFDPRLGFAFQIAKTTVLRGGAGLFHDRLSIGNVETVQRLDGTRQLQILVPFPLTFPVIPEGAAIPPASLRTFGKDLADPYSINESISLEQGLFNGFGLTFSYDAERGIHQLRSRNINAPLPLTGVRPDPTKGNLYQLESTGLSRANNFTIGTRGQLRGKLQAFVFGSYTLGYAKSDSDGATSLPVNSYDMRSEWGRAGNDVRNQLNFGGQLQLPWGIRTTLQMNLSSGRPYNITTGRDDNGDGTINDRPTDIALCEFFLGSNCSSLSGSVISRNTGTGPGYFNMNMNFQKTVRLKHPESTPSDRAGNGGLNGVNNFVEPQRGGGGFGGGDRGGFQGGGNRGGRGGRGGNFPDGGQRGNFNQNNGPSVTFQVQFQNLTNHTQLNGYSGTMSSPFFGRSSSARNPRQVELGLRLNF